MFDITSDVMTWSKVKFGNRLIHGKVFEYKFEHNNFSVQSASKTFEEDYYKFIFFVAFYFVGVDWGNRYNFTRNKSH